MQFDWQTIAALALVGLAAAYLFARARRWWGGKESGACGGCSACAAPTTSAPGFVSLDALQKLPSSVARRSAP